MIRTGWGVAPAGRDRFDIAFGGFKQSGIGREGGREGLYAYLETKTVVLDELGYNTTNVDDVPPELQEQRLPDFVPKDRAS